MSRQPHPPSYWALVLLLLLLSVLASTAVADSSCNGQAGTVCETATCPGSSTCTGCSVWMGLAQPQCGPDTDTTALAGGVIAAIVLAPVIVFIVVVSVVCCMRGLFCFDAARRGAWGWPRGVVYCPPIKSVGLYGGFGPTVILNNNTTVSNVQLVQPQPVYGQGMNMMQNQPAMYAMAPQQQNAQPGAQYSASSQYAVPQQQYSYQPQQMSNRPPPQQWQPNNQPQQQPIYVNPAPHAQYPLLGTYPPQEQRQQQQEQWRDVEKPQM